MKPSIIGIVAALLAVAAIVGIAVYNITVGAQDVAAVTTAATEAPNSPGQRTQLLDGSSIGRLTFPPGNTATGGRLYRLTASGAKPQKALHYMCMRISRSFKTVKRYKYRQTSASCQGVNACIVFAALNTHAGHIIEQCLPRHRHTEVLQFLDRIESSVPPKLDVHLIMDNYATHKHPL